MTTSLTQAHNHLKEQVLALNNPVKIIDRKILDTQAKDNFGRAMSDAKRAHSKEYYFESTALLDSDTDNSELYYDRDRWSYFEVQMISNELANIVNRGVPIKP